MACTTILVGCGATNDGSTLVARNEDTGNGTFNAKKLVVIEPEDQPRTYTGVESHLTMELPDSPLRYMCTPNADPTGGVWGEAGINAANVCMSATETISSNARVLGADPLICYTPAKGKEGEPGYEPERPGGIGEENLITIILPYIRSAREGVLRMGALLEEYGTYEMNGVAFGDEKEVWYIETIGGHHWIARRVPDDCYVAQPNRQGIDWFDLKDAFGEQKDYMCSKDLPHWMAENHLNMVFEADGTETMEGIPVQFNPRFAFTSWTWLDTVYNDPRAWYIYKEFNPTDERFNGPGAIYSPESMNLPWCMKPEAKISVLDVKNMLSTTYDGTIYNPYTDKKGTPDSRHRYRPIGINRTSECSVLQIRGYAPKAVRGVQWISMGSGPFNTAVAMFSNVHQVPAYFDTDPDEVTTENLYWADRIIAAMADCEFFDNLEPLYNYQQECMTRGYTNLHKVDAIAAAQGAGADDMDNTEMIRTLEDVNAALVNYVKEQTNDLLKTVLYTRSYYMNNAFGASDH